MPHVLSLRPVTIQTTLGHCVAVPARVPTFVTANVLPFAVMKGCVPCTEKGDVLSEEEEQQIVQGSQAERVFRKQAEMDPLTMDIDSDEDAPPAPSSPAPASAPVVQLGEPPADVGERKQAIRFAVKKLTDENDPVSFKKDGTPKAHPLNRAAGFHVDPLELLEVLGEPPTE